jgi:hypothetical protein
MPEENQKKVNWDETKEKLKKQFARLSENGELTDEKQTEILNRLQIKLGKTREEIKKFISEK